MPTPTDEPARPNRPNGSNGAVPELSVVVPTHGRPERVAALVERLARQTLAPERFELVLVDDGTDPPIRVADPPYRVVLLRQRNAGPAAARNAALARCRAPLALILNDDAVPADDLLAKHLEVHATEARAGREPVAVLGTFRFAPSAIAASPFVELLDRTDLLFDFSTLRHGERHGWTSFWTCNLSVATQVLRDAGGFDAERFPDAVGEDVELGWRLERRGVRVLFRDDLRAHHDHVLTPAAYFARAARLGKALARMHAKHGDPAMLRLAPDERADGSGGAAFRRKLQATYEALAPSVAKVEALLAKVEREHAGRALPPQLVAQLSAAVARVAAAPLARGMLAELAGSDPEPAFTRGPTTGKLTSIVIVSYEALDATRTCIEALRRTREDAHPIEIVVADNGSKDGSREWLAAQEDVVLVANAANLGAPRARNQALRRARGEHVVFLDNDVVVTAGWLSKLLWHAEVDAAAACVGPVTDRAAHGQAIEVSGRIDDVARLEAVAAERARSHRRQFRHASLLSSFCLLVKRSTLDAIGGFDEAFSPWGFEDDDFTLRAALNGRHNRVALDVFVRHAAYRSGAKAERHTELLEKNWTAFRAKWGLPAGAARGDYAALAPLLDADVPRERVHVPFLTTSSNERVLPCAT